MKAVVAFVGDHQLGTATEPRPAKIVQLHVLPADAGAFSLGATIEIELDAAGEPLEFPVVPAAPAP